jgi:tRNA modification GTPase
MSTPAAVTSTLVAVLTPPGSAAIATLALRGPAAWDVLAGLFRPRGSTKTWPPPGADAGQIYLGRFGLDAPGAPADDIVLSVHQTSPEPWLELHAHGGVEVVRWLVESLQARGAVICTWQQLQTSTGTTTLQAAALKALTQAPTARTAAILLDQYHGALARALNAVLLALDNGDSASANSMLASLTRYSRLGCHLTTPWRVAVLGAPNVGKSSLVNALAGFQRSIVTATPGTTRDVVSTQLAIDAWPVELLDTAGIRDAPTGLEQAGIVLANEAARQADLCLWLVDAADEHVPCTPSVPAARVVINKIDLPAAWDLGLLPDAVRVSARTGAGLAQLCDAISSWLVPDPPLSGSAVPFSAPVAEVLEKIHEALVSANPDAARQILTGLLQ